jgi:hypothetical protein
MSIKQKLQKTVNEKDVENVYRSELIKIDDATITSPYGVLYVNKKTYKFI